MRNILIFLVVSVVVGIGYVYHTSSSPDGKQNSNQTEPTFYSGVKSDTGSMTLSAPTKALAEEGIPSEVELTEVVLGVEVLKDRNCDPVRNKVYLKDGSEVFAIQCIPLDSEMNHPYTTYSDETLLSMAYGDSLASEIYGHRIMDDGNIEEGLKFIYNALALEGGKSFDQMHEVVNKYLAGLYGEGLKPNLEVMKLRYIAEFVGVQLGHDEIFLQMLKDELTKAAIDIGELEAEALAIVDGMALTQENVTGDRTIRQLLEENNHA